MSNKKNQTETVETTVESTEEVAQTQKFWHKFPRATKVAATIAVAATAVGAAVLSAKNTRDIGHLNEANDDLIDVVSDLVDLNEETTTEE